MNAAEGGRKKRKAHHRVRLSWVSEQAQRDPPDPPLPRAPPELPESLPLPERLPERSDDVFDSLVSLESDMLPDRRFSSPYPDPAPLIPELPEIPGSPCEPRRDELDESLFRSFAIRPPAFSGALESLHLAHGELPPLPVTKAKFKPFTPFPRAREMCSMPDIPHVGQLFFGTIVMPPLASTIACFI